MTKLLRKYRRSNLNTAYYFNVLPTYTSPKSVIPANIIKKNADVNSKYIRSRSSARHI